MLTHILFEYYNLTSIISIGGGGGSECQEKAGISIGWGRFEGLSGCDDANIGVDLAIDEDYGHFGDLGVELFEFVVELEIIVSPVDIRMFFDAGKDEMRDGHILLEVLLCDFEDLFNLFILLYLLEVICWMVLHLKVNGIVNHGCFLAHFHHISQ